MHSPHNPYEPPQADLDDGDYDVPPLYNPNAAALWSLLFTPFGAWMHAKNWEAVGEEELARKNRLFAIGVVAFILITAAIEFITGITLPSAVIGIVPLVVWYLQLGKQQIELIKEELGDDYERKSLVMPVLVGVFGGIALLFVVIFAMAYLFDALGLMHPNNFKN